MLDSVYVKPLALTRIGAISEQILKKSIAEFVELTPNININHEAITHEQACLGILQEIDRSAITEREATQTRFSRHAVSTEGLGILSNLAHSRQKTCVVRKDVRRLRGLDIANYLQYILQSTIPKYVQPPTRENIEAWVHNSPPQQLPWYGLVEWLYSGGILEEVLRRLSILVGISPRGCYYNISGATHYIGLLPSNVRTISLLSAHNHLKQLQH